MGKVAASPARTQMQSRNPFVDELGKAMESAFGVAQAAGEEAKSLLRAQADHWASELDLVRRDEFDALRDTLTAEIAALRDQLTKLLTTEAKTRATDDAG